MRIKTDGSRLDVLASDVAADGGIAVTDSEGPDADRAWVYWVEPSTGLVQRVEVDASGALGGVEVIASGEDRPTWLAADGQSVYWGARNTGEIRRATMATGDIETIALDDDSAGFASDEEFIYWGGHPAVQHSLGHRSHLECECH